MMQQLISLLISILLFAGLLLNHPPTAAANQLTWADSPATDTTAFQKAIAPKSWNFPEDFGPHNDYQTEWWYYTGNLETEEGRPFGFQLTFFRQALQPDLPVASTQSNWRNNQIYSAHFTISDIQNQKFYPYERFSRSVLKLAGAETNPYHVWLEDWTVTAIALNKVRLYAQTFDVTLDLVLTQSLPPILQGDRGLSIKGKEQGNASYYYSLVQQPTTGTLTLNKQTFHVKGVTWKDHEYSTSALSPGTVGWDWFSLQFNDGSALMLYNLRHEDNTSEETSAGIFISSTGDQIPLTLEDWKLNVTNTWKSPISKAIYPSKWLLKIPKLALTLQGQSLMPNQELNTSTATYWEGAIKFEGTQQDTALIGRGYAELTGYANRLDSLLSARSH